MAGAGGSAGKKGAAGGAGRIGLNFRFAPWGRPLREARPICARAGKRREVGAGGQGGARAFRPGSGPIQAVVQVLQQATVDGRKRGNVGQGDVLVDFVDAGVGRAQFDDFGANLGDEAPVAGAAAG